MMAEAALIAMDRARLDSLEQVVAHGVGTFREVGNALMEIRDRRGYRLDGHHTFAEYCEKRWGWTRQHGYQLIGAAQFATELEAEAEMSTTVDIRVPETEYEAREMMRARRNGHSEPAHPTLASETAELADDMAPLLDMPTPQQMAYDDPGRRWHRSLHDLYVFIRSTGQNGGIAALTSGWPPQTKREYADELQRVRDVLGDWQSVLEEQLGGS